MTMYITQQNHGKYQFLLNWANPDTGACMGQWFETMKDLREYIRLWGATIVYTKKAGA